MFIYIYNHASCDDYYCFYHLTFWITKSYRIYFYLNFKLKSKKDVLGFSPKEKLKEKLKNKPFYR